MQLNGILGFSGIKKKSFAVFCEKQMVFMPTSQFTFIYNYFFEFVCSVVLLGCESEIVSDS